MARMTREERFTESEILAKARKLLEALTEPHETVERDGEHAWRKCRRCLAREELEYDSSIPMWLAILTALQQAADDARAVERHPARQVGLALANSAPDDSKTAMCDRTET